LTGSQFVTQPGVFVGILSKFIKMIHHELLLCAATRRLNMYVQFNLLGTLSQIRPMYVF